MLTIGRDEKLLAAIKKAVAQELSQEIIQLKRRLARTQTQRDAWRESSQRYRQNLIEKQQRLGPDSR